MKANDIIGAGDPIAVRLQQSMTEHDKQLKCCLCFKPLSMEECNTTMPDGEREDVCLECAAYEALK